MEWEDFTTGRCCLTYSGVLHNLPVSTLSSGIGSSSVILLLSVIFTSQAHQADSLVRAHVLGSQSWFMCWDVSFGVHALLLLLPLCPQTLLSVNPSLTSADLNSSRHASYTAKTLRDSQVSPNSDSLWKEAKRRQPSGFPVRLLSWIKQSNRQHETLSAGTSSAYCSLFGKELNRR